MSYSSFADIIAEATRGEQGAFRFDASKHEFLLAMNAAYQAWWEALPGDERQGYEETSVEYIRGALEEKERRDRREVELAQLRSVAAAKARLERIGVPAKDIERIHSGDMKETSAMSECRSFLADGDRILVLSGERGCGKTTAAAWLLSQELEGPRSYEEALRLIPMSASAESWGRPYLDRTPRRGGPSVFVDVSKLARLSRYRSDDMDPLEEALLLVIDDLGMEYADEKGSFLSTLDGLFNARYAAQLYTVITTNLPAKAFKARYGERIADRIRECGRFVELSDKSLRGVQ